MELLNTLKIKGINDYLNNNKIIFNTYEELILNSVESYSDILLSERKRLLATYLLIYGLEKSEHIMSNLNYKDFNKYSKDLADILINSLSKDILIIEKKKDNQILALITSHILKNYILDEEKKHLIFETLYIEGEEENEFLSFNKLKPIIIELMKKYEFFEDIHYIIEYIIMEYKKIEALEFIDREEIEKYEIFYRLENNKEIKEILYKV